MEVSGAHWPSRDDVLTTARSFITPCAEKIERHGVS